jgi:hypothetical protein
MREPAPSEYEGRPSQCPRTYFHDDPRGGRGRQFSKAKIRALDDRKLGRVEVERIRDMWELRCNRALRKARMSEGVNRGSLKAQGIDRPATKHLGSKASAMNRNGCLLRKAEINQLVSFDSRRLAEINNQLNQLKTMRIESPANSPLNLKSVQQRCPIWRERTTRVDPSPNARSNGVAVHGKPSAAHHGNRRPANPSKTRPAHQDPARELAYLLAR